MRSGRCEECRRRRRKCDELRPKCSLCLKADVSCSYPVYHNFMPSFQPPAPAEKSRPASNNHTLFWQNSVQPSEISSGVLRIKVAAKLKLRTIKVAPTGTGSFYTFSLAPCRQASQAQVHEVNSGLSFRSVESGMSKLCKAFSAIIADESQSSFCFSLQSDWLSYIPSRLAHSDLLRAAAICTVLTFSSRGSANERLKHDALKSYVSVVQQLRLTLASKDKQMNDEVVAAMKLLEIHDLTLQPHVLSWRAHAFASLEFMIAAGPGFCHTEFGRSLFTSSIGMGWFKGLVTGEPSPFDDSRWLALRPESCFNALVLETQDGPWQRARVLTLLPRLVQLIRHVKQDRGDRTSLFAAAAVANELLGFLWGAGAKTLPASWHTQPDAVDTIVLPFRLRLPEPSYRRAVAYSMHWALKSKLAFLCQSLLALGLAQPQHWPSCASFAEEERQCAVLICAAIPRCTSDMWPHTASATMFSLQAAWGTLWRFSEIRKEEDDHDHDEAGALMLWLEARISEFAAAMNNTVTRDSLIEYTKIVQGDALWMFG